MDKVNIAIVGATGAVGEELISALQERNFPVGEIRLFSSQRSAGARVAWGDRTIRVETVEDTDLTGVKVAFFSAGGDVSLKYAAHS